MNLIRKILAELSRPQDFAGNPVGGGLNQMGHVIAGAALAAVLPLPVVLLGVLIWEVWQFKERGATANDLRLDVLYWSVGAVGWSVSIAEGFVTGFPVYAPVVAVVAFVAEAVRIEWRRR